MLKNTFFIEDYLLNVGNKKALEKGFLFLLRNTYLYLNK